MKAPLTKARLMRILKVHVQASREHTARHLEYVGVRQVVASLAATEPTYAEAVSFLLRCGLAEVEVPRFREQYEATHQLTAGAR